LAPLKLNVLEKLKFRNQKMRNFRLDFDLLNIKF